MYRTLRAISAIILFLALGSAQSQSFGSTKTLSLVPPAGFSGPLSASPGDGAETYAYSRDRPEGQPRTLLQITKFDSGDRLKNLSESERHALTRRYLSEFLKGIERRRTNYKQSEPTDLVLGGEPAARAEWSGSIGGIEAHGVMYAVIVGPVVYQLHTQDSVSAPEVDMQNAVRSIESLEFKSHG